MWKIGVIKVETKIHLYVLYCKLFANWQNTLPNVCIIICG